MKKLLPTSAHAWESKIEGYFLSCEGPRLDKNGNPIVDNEGNPIRTVVKPYTVTGLAYALGVESRDALYKIPGNAGCLVRRALLKIEEYAEQQLFFKESHAGSKLFLEVNFERWKEALPQDEPLLVEIGPWGR
ncbi:MAG TPA: hypothetical protein DCY74_09635 [Clostridiales bacterium]|nr:hypothetical protein [Clostridiales bacterium]HBE14418.1 hypothetical protein [Clostridiales bacterium]HCG35866.1 hypothetical protein [Clostridiales bacterium]